MAENQPLKSSLENQQRIKSDHELFLEAYEKPTQIYRFLRSRHLLEPIFLQRNLAYMKERQSSKRRTRRKSMRLNDLAKQTKDKRDISTEIKSDNQLRITFHSIDCRKTSSPNVSSMPNVGSPMIVEVLLYRFKQPSPEVLVTNPTSLPCDYTVLGKCLLPNSDSSQSDKCSITVPGSVLSWKDTEGVLGTQMLAFRVTPLSQEDKNCCVASSERKQIRKRCQNGSSDVMINCVPPPPSPSPPSPTSTRVAMNGFLYSKPTEEHGVAAMEESHIEDHIEENGYHSPPPQVLNNDSRLHKKAPGGKTLPTISVPHNNLVISIARNSLESSGTENMRFNAAKNRRTQVQLLLDGDRPKGQCTKWEQNLDSTPRVTRSLAVGESIDIETNSRKRTHSDSGVLQPFHSNSRQLSEPLQEDPCSPPPSKRACCGMYDSTIFSPATPTTPSRNADTYYAELVAFDSRQECLLLDGEYELSLTQMKRKMAESRGNGLTTPSLFNWDMNHRILSLEVLSLKLSVEWSLGPPRPRIEELNDTALDFAKLRQKYDELITSLTAAQSSTNSISPLAAAAMTQPHALKNSTVFNFMYNKNTLQQTELKTNCVCPWCSMDCEQLYPLLKHMSLCHSRFLFTYSPIEGGANIDVRMNRMYDSHPLDDPVEKDSLIRKKKPTKCQPCTSVLVKKKVASTIQDDLSEFTASKQFSRPKSSRLFYHTYSCLPMVGNEKDSDEETVPKWLKTTSSKMVDEFIDVNQGEKQFMKMWNLFTMEHMTIADKQVPHFCLLFAQKNKQVLLEKHLEYNFLSHVIYMCDIGLVPPSTITEIRKVLLHVSSSSMASTY